MSQDEFRARIRRDPKWFAESALGRSIWEKQEEIIRAVMEHRRVAACGCVSSSKTNAAAITALSWLFAFQPARVFTMAPSYRQVDNNLWGELRQMIPNARVPLGGRLYETTKYELAANWYALGFSTKEPEMVHGLHGENDLLIIDDAHGVPQRIFDEVENMMAGGNTHVLLLYNPVILSGETYECSRSKRGLYHNIRISFDDTPNAKAPEDKPAIPGMLLRRTAKEWAKTYGKDSNFYRTKVLALYPKQERDTLIPLDWVEAAVARSVPESDEPTRYGMDVARFGDDESVVCGIKGRRTLPLDAWKGKSTSESAGLLKAKLDEEEGSSASVDVIGLGAGVVDPLVEQGCQVNAVNVAEKSLELNDAGGERFANLRSEIWWAAREAINPANEDALSLPQDNELIAELTAVRYKLDSKGRIMVEPKDGESEKWGLRKRLGKSPDRADAFCLAVHERRTGGSSGGIIHVV